MSQCVSIVTRRKKLKSGERKSYVISILERQDLGDFNNTEFKKAETKRLNVKEFDDLDSAEAQEHLAECYRIINELCTRQMRAEKL